jgi:hypothetical protein
VSASINLACVTTGSFKPARVPEALRVRLLGGAAANHEEQA